MSQDIVLSLQKQNRLLKSLLGLGAIAMTLTLGVAATSAKTRFAEIDVERINIVGADGKRQLVIANRDRLPKAMINGNEVKEDRAMPGLIFYNEAGDECGGLIWKGKLDANGKPSSGMHFSMDRFGGDQQLALGHYEGNGFMNTGLNIYDNGLQREIDALEAAIAKAPEGPEREAARKKLKESGLFQTQRVFVGKSRGKSSTVILADAKGRPRIMMLVTPEGQSSLQFLDEKGQVVESLPKADRKKNS